MDTVTRKRKSLTLDQLMDLESRLQYYEFQGNKIRVLEDDDGLLIVLTDILRAVQYKASASNVVKRLQDEDFALKEIGAKSALANCVNRRGLYTFTLCASAPQVLEFYRWAKKTIWGQGKGVTMWRDQIGWMNGFEKMGHMLTKRNSSLHCCSSARMRG